MIKQMNPKRNKKQGRLNPQEVFQSQNPNPLSVGEEADEIKTNQ